MSKKYVCEPCNYDTVKLSNLNKHLKTKKHLDTVTNDSLNVTKVSVNLTKKLVSKSKKKSTFKCEYCDTVFGYKHHLKYHTTACKIRTNQERENLIKSIQEEKDGIIKRLEEENKEAYKKIEEVTKLKEKAEENYINELKEFRTGIQTGAITVNNNNTTNNVNIEKLNVFYVIKNYKSAHNYEDLMDPPLTEAEITHIQDYGPSAGCERLILNRCVDNIAKEMRPIHCVDASREKFMIKTKGEWELDVDKDDILQPAFKQVRTQFDISDNNKDIMDKVKNLQLLQKMDTVGGRKTIKNLIKKTLLKNKGKVKSKAVKDKAKDTVKGKAKVKVNAKANT